MIVITNFIGSRLCSSIQSAVSDAGLSRAGIAAAAVAVPLVAIGGLALLSPLALGRKKRDLDGEGNNNVRLLVISLD